MPLTEEESKKLAHLAKPETNKIRKFFLGVILILFLPMAIAWIVASKTKPIPYNENMTTFVSWCGIAFFILLFVVFLTSILDRENNIKLMLKIIEKLQREITELKGKKQREKKGE